MGNTVLYCRTANGGAEEAKLQLDMLNQHAWELGYIPNRAYFDWNRSGATLDRPSLQKLLSDVRAGEVERVIVYNLSKLARGMMLMNELFSIFREFRVEVISAKEGSAVDMAWPNEFADAIIAFARNERKRRSRAAAV